MPRRSLRSLRTPCAVAALAAALGGVPSAARAAEILADGPAGCSLAAAIAAANADTDGGGCVATGDPYGVDTILLAYDVVLTAPDVSSSSPGGAAAGLPDVTSEMTIDGEHAIERDAALGCDFADPDSFRLLNVLAGGRLHLRHVQLRHGCVAPATGAARGGAVYLAGDGLELVSVRVEANGALGSESNQNGNAYGGAVYAEAGQVDVFDSTFADNAARTADFDPEVAGSSNAAGGAIFVATGAGLMLCGDAGGSLFEGNSAVAGSGGGSAGGGAVSYNGSAPLAIDHTLFRDNTAQGGAPRGPAIGGALDSGSNSGSIRQSAFVGNTAVAGLPLDVAGTTAYAGAASLAAIDEVSAVSFLDNRVEVPDGPGGGSAFGGALVVGDAGTLENLTFSGNAAVVVGGTAVLIGVARGGALWLDGGSVQALHHVTMVDNRAEATQDGSLASGGGLAIAAFATVDRFDDNLLAGNTIQTAAGTVAQDCRLEASDRFTAGAYNLIRDPDNCAVSEIGTLIQDDPLVAAPADNGCLPGTEAGGACPPTVRLTRDSPAVDAGDCTTSNVFEDARGVSRPWDFALPDGPGDECDIGAYELEELVDLTLDAAVAPSPAILGAGRTATCTLALANDASRAGLPATAIAVEVTFTVPDDVAPPSVAVSAGSWDGTTWHLPTLDVGADATLTATFALDAAHPQAAALGCAGVVTSAAELDADGAYPGASALADVATDGVFATGFESDDAGWSVFGP